MAYFLNFVKYLNSECFQNFGYNLVVLRFSSAFLTVAVGLSNPALSALLTSVISGNHLAGCPNRLLAQAEAVVYKSNYVIYLDPRL